MGASTHELSPFRTIINLNAPPPMITLDCPLIDVTPDFWSATDAGWPGCGMHSWSGGHYIISTSKSMTHFWDGDAWWGGLKGGALIANGALPGISTPLTWGAGLYSYRYRLSPPFEPLLARAGRWVPLEGADVEGHAGYKQGNQVSLRYWGHAATGPLECVVNQMYPQIQDSGRLEIANPPEEREDLAQFPGALTITFAEQVVGGIAYEPVGVAAGYSRTFNANWLGGEQPTVSVLYRVKTS